MPRSKGSPGSATETKSAAKARAHQDGSGGSAGGGGSAKDTRTVHRLLTRECDPTHSFLLCTGAIIRSIKQLADSLEHVDDSVYFYHATADRNDFAQWVKDVFNEDTLASKMRASHSRDHLRATIYQSLLEHASRGR